MSGLKTNDDSEESGEDFAASFAVEIEKEQAEKKPHPKSTDKDWFEVGGKLAKTQDKKPSKSEA